MWKESHKLILGSGGIETGGMCLSVVEVIVTDDDSLSTQEQNIWKNSALYQRSATLSGYVIGARAESFISNKATHLHSIDNWGTQVHWVIFHFSEQTIKDQFKYIAYHFLVQTERKHKANKRENANKMLCFFYCLEDGKQMLRHLKLHNSAGV